MSWKAKRFGSGAQVGVGVVVGEGVEAVVVGSEFGGDGREGEAGQGGRAPR
jgi:hypothetical protein